MSDHVVLVDNNDLEIGTMPKLEAHEKGILHRAFSVFLFNSKGEMLLQQRALNKYHSGGLWSNTCCSHPFPGEQTHDAAKRRLLEEMGINTPINPIYSFIYKTQLDNGLSEHEFDHVFFGIYDNEPVSDKNEIVNWKYIGIPELLNDLKLNSNNYTEWFKICLPDVLNRISF